MEKIVHVLSARNKQMHDLRDGISNPTACKRWGKLGGNVIDVRMARSSIVAVAMAEEIGNGRLCGHCAKSTDWR